MQNHEIMTTKQLAEYLKVSPHSRYKLVKWGTFPTFKIVNRWWFERLKIDHNRYREGVNLITLVKDEV